MPGKNKQASSESTTSKVKAITMKKKTPPSVMNVKSNTRVQTTLLSFVKTTTSTTITQTIATEDATTTTHTVAAVEVAPKPSVTPTELDEITALAHINMVINEEAPPSPILPIGNATMPSADEEYRFNSRMMHLDRLSFPFPAVRYLTGARTVSSMEVSKDYPDRFVVVFCNMVMGEIDYNDKTGHGAPIPELGGRIYAYRVDGVEFEKFLRFAIITPEFGGSTMEELSGLADYLCNKFKARERPGVPGAYTKEKELWTRSSVHQWTRKTYQQRSKVNAATLMQTLYNDTKKNMEEHPSMTRDEALGHITGTFWHLVSFACILSIHFCGHERTFCILLGILWRDMVCDARDPWDHDDVDMSMLGMKSSISKTESILWSAMAGLLEMVMFQGMTNSAFEKLKFDIGLFTSQQYIFFNLTLKHVLSLRRSYATLDDTRNGMCRVEPPQLVQEIYHVEPTFLEK